MSLIMYTTTTTTSSRKQMPLFPPDADKFLFREDFQMLMERRKDMTALIKGKQHPRWK
jgi:hypothetical protein